MHQRVALLLVCRTLWQERPSLPRPATEASRDGNCSKGKSVSVHWEAPGKICSTIERENLRGHNRPSRSSSRSIQMITSQRSTHLVPAELVRLPQDIERERSRRFEKPGCSFPFRGDRLDLRLQKGLQRIIACVWIIPCVELLHSIGFHLAGFILTAVRVNP